MEIMKKISISKELKTLSSERVLEELTKALLNPGPNLFFQALTALGDLPGISVGHVVGMFSPARPL